MLVGASNIWFPVNLSALSIPSDSGELEQRVEEYWSLLEAAKTPDILAAFRSVGNLDAFAKWNDEQLWAAVASKRSASSAQANPKSFRELKGEEWEVFSNPEDAPKSNDFRLVQSEVPDGWGAFLERVVCVERLRVVKALVGFTRIMSPGDYADASEIPELRRAPLGRKPPGWVPAAEIRGEGLFLQFREDALRSWEEMPGVVDRLRVFAQAHTRFRKARNIEPHSAGFPGGRYFIIHSFSHALLRQLAIECGYGAASLQERIYSSEGDGEPMAGLLLYTAAADSEGTLGGLVSLGEPTALGRHLDAALEEMRLCASDPLCAEHLPVESASTLHGAACHACLFASETSCERGNKYLDRGVLVDLIGGNPTPFFESR